MAVSAFKENDSKKFFEATQAFSQLINTAGEPDKVLDRSVSFLIKQTEAFQGSVYLEQGGKFVLKACYHENEEVYSVKQFYLQGKGVVGKVAEDQEPHYYTNIPESFFTDFKSALKGKLPQSLFLAPLLSSEGAFGVLQLAAAEELSEYSQLIVQQVAQSLGARLFVEKSMGLGEGTDEHAAELYRKNKLLSEAKKAAQQSNQELRKQVKEAEEKEQLLMALLNKVNEAVMLFDGDLQLKLAGGATKRILGISPLSINISRQLPAHLIELEESIRDLIKQLPEGSEAERQKDILVPSESGELAWLSVSVSRIVLTGGQYFLLAVKDISAKKEQSKSLQVPGQMQALAENTPDSVLRISADNKLQYANPAFEELTGLDRNQIVGQSFSDLRVEQRILKSWESQVNYVFEQKQPLQSTTSISNYAGERFLQISILPEFDKKGDLQSALLVLRDNTENKRTKVAIRNQSEKIKYGETYAKNIQQIVIPTRRVVQQTFPDSFILSKPKNTIPGDFPWCYRSGNYIYLATVDTKEIGVSGALNSLNIYYLLVQIMDNWHGEGLPKPSDILVSLHNILRKKFTSKLSALSSKTGIDISMCRIHLKEKDLLYSGANIPMYLMRDSRVEVLKGTSYSLGIQRSLKDETFKDAHRSISEKDLLLLATDGLQNTFGGQRFKRYSSERIRDVLMQHAGEPMFALSDIYEEDLGRWLNGKRQIDDILLLGARLTPLGEEAEEASTEVTPEGNIEVGGQEVEIAQTETVDYSTLKLADLANKHLDRMHQGTLIASHEGNYNQATIKDITAKTEAYLQQNNETRGFTKKVFNVMVEMLQNISRHAYNLDENLSNERYGFFAMLEQVERYEIITANYIKKPVAQKVHAVLEDLRDRDAEELKKRYKDLMKKSRINEEGGAGLGFVDIARKTDQQMFFHFEPVDEHVSIFILRSAINKKT